jgi:carbonic anhydrase
MDQKHYHDYPELIKNNNEWAEEKKAQNPEYFKWLAEGQPPPSFL